MFNLRKSNSALRAADNDTITTKLSTNRDDKIFAFLRKNKDQGILVILNFSPKVIHVVLRNIRGVFKNVFSGEYFNTSINSNLPLGPWGYFVFEEAEIK